MVNEQINDIIIQTTMTHKGLYRADMEHDACGVGMVVNIHGGKSHELVDQALRVLENMEHRGRDTRQDWRRRWHHAADTP